MAKWLLLCRCAVLYLLELGVGPIGDPLGDVVDVGAGGAGETVAATSTLHIEGAEELRLKMTKNQEGFGHHPLDAEY